MKSVTPTATLQARLDGYMQKAGLRSTAQRRLVTEVFFETEAHLSIDELLALVRKRDSKVGYATVYRTLKMLAASGLANARQFGDGMTRYEVAHAGHHHDHLICLQCGHIEEFEDDRIEHLQDNIARRHGFQLKSHKHELYGICKACRS